MARPPVAEHRGLPALSGPVFPEGPGQLALPRGAALREAHPSLRLKPSYLAPAHPVGDLGWLGSPELWEASCCFSPRLFPWLGSN